MGEGGVGGTGGVGAAGDCVVDGALWLVLMARVLLLMVLGVCLRLLWPGLGGLLVHRLCWLWFPLVAEIAGGDADGGVMLGMVCLMLLAWVM